MSFSDSWVAPIEDGRELQAIVTYTGDSADVVALVLDGPEHRVAIGKATAVFENPYGSDKGKVLGFTVQEEHARYQVFERSLGAAVKRFGAKLVEQVAKGA